LVLLLKKAAPSAAPLRHLQELMDAEGKALEVRHHLSVIDERRRWSLPANPSGIRRIRIDEEIVRDFTPAEARAKEVYAEYLSIGETIPYREGEVLHVGIAVGRGQRVRQRRVGAEGHVGIELQEQLERRTVTHDRAV